MYWANNVAKEVLEEAHDLLKNHAQLTTTKGRALRDYLRSNPMQRADYKNVSAKACSAGSIAHDLVELWVHGNKTIRSNLARTTPRMIAVNNKTTMEIAKLAHRAFQAFLEWAKLNKFDLWETEVPMVSDEHNFGGTLDCLGTVKGKFCLLDWKTSKALYADYLLQLAAYTLIWNENYDPPIEEVHLVRFDKLTGEFEHFHTDDLEDLKDAFIRMRELYTIMQQVEKRI